jgi:pimeloyl-ACP methyl ester carboxylesterase
VNYLAQRHDVVSGNRVGLLGFSFAGGLSLIAASHPETQRHLKYVTSVGGHYDLSNVMQFLITGQLATPHGTRPTKPHEYGLVILTYQHLAHFVPEPDRDAVRRAFVAWLHEDREAARNAAQALTTPEGQRLFKLLENQQLAELSQDLLQILDAHRVEMAELSPKDRLKQLHIPTHLLHGTGDAVIPAAEAEWADRELSGASVPHLTLVTPLIEHVEVEGDPTLLDKFRLVRFMAQLF